MTIEFKKNDHIDENKLNEAEAFQFVYEFLEPELHRHMKLEVQAQINARMCMINGEKVTQVAWKSSSLEHTKDICYITDTMHKLRAKFRWADD